MSAVLIVEDDDDIREILKECVAEVTSEIFAAENGLQAVDILRTESNIGVILSDIKMPKMDGIELLKEISKLEINARFVFLTGYADDYLKQKTSLPNIFALVQKPFLVSDLTKVIADALRGANADLDAAPLKDSKQAG